MRNPPEETHVTPATRRRSWPVRKYPLGFEPSDDLSGSTTPEQRLGMMWPLALEAWALTGRPLPGYDRDSAPVCRFRLGDAKD